MFTSHLPELAQKRLQHHLETQSLLIEDTVSDYAPRHSFVAGGDVYRDHILYRLEAPEPALPRRMIERALRRRLGVKARLQRHGGEWSVKVARPSPPVDLLQLMARYRTPQMGGETAVLGLDRGGQPVTVDLALAGHLLLLGNGGCGKTALMRSLALSLALTHRPSQMQFLFIQPSAAEGLTPLNYLPCSYLLHPVINDGETAVRALNRVLERRQTAAAGQTRILILLDDLEALLASGGTPFLAALTRLLLLPGPITLVAGARQPEDALLNYTGGSWRTRIVGRMADAAAAKAATGNTGTKAEELPTAGGFLLVQPVAAPRYFQAAFATRYDMGFALAWLRRGEQPAVIVPEPAPATAVPAL